MNIIINEYQYKNILLEGKRATIFHKAAAGTTNQENLIDGDFDTNKKKISLFNYLRVPGNKLIPNQSILYDINSNILLYVAHDQNKVKYVRTTGETEVSLIKNIFIIP